MNVPIIGQKKKSLPDFPLMAKDEINFMVQITEDLLKQGIPPEVPAVAMPLGNQARMVRSLSSFHAVISRMAELVEARPDFAILSHAEPDLHAWYLSAREILDIAAPQQPNVLVP